MALKLSAPWVSFAREIHALFEKDPEVKVVYDEENLEIKLFVESQDKATALMDLLPVTKTFGNVSLKITVVPANNLKASNLDIFKKAFAGNPIVTNIIDNTDVGPGSFEAGYVLFEKKVVQYFNDDLSDANRVKSTLYADIAKDVFGEHDTIYFCTDVKDPEESALNSPLGEWP